VVYGCSKDRFVKPASIAVIALGGELEIGRKAEIRAALQMIESATSVLIDLSEVTYADSTALAELMRFRREADTRSVSVAILIGHRQFSRLLEYAGLSQMFAVFDSRAAALSYLAAPKTT
jgi:anti-anti-sigma factor